jgi:pyridoxine 5-phosphate synthase
LVVNAGHGLDYTNVKEIARINHMEELNIGHSIIAESIFLGLAEAIKKMKNLIESS